jgi:hypothetical protein
MGEHYVKEDPLRGAGRKKDLNFLIRAFKSIFQSCQKFGRERIK